MIGKILDKFWPVVRTVCYARVKMKSNIPQYINDYADTDHSLSDHNMAVNKGVIIYRLIN